LLSPVVVVLQDPTVQGGEERAVKKMYPCFRGLNFKRQFF
jgi:hypothetical protein